MKGPKDPIKKYRIAEFKGMFYPQIYVEYFFFSRYERISNLFTLSTDLYRYGFLDLQSAKEHIIKYEEYIKNLTEIKYHSFD